MLNRKCKLMNHNKCVPCSFVTFDLMPALCKYIHVYYVSHLDSSQLTHKCLSFSNNFLLLFRL